MLFLSSPVKTRVFGFAFLALVAESLAGCFGTKKISNSANAGPDHNIGCNDNVSRLKKSIREALQYGSILKLEALLSEYVYAKPSADDGYNNQYHRAMLLDQIVALQKPVLEEVFHVDWQNHGIGYITADRMLILLQLYRRHGGKLIDVLQLFQSHKRSFFAEGSHSSFEQYGFLDHYTVEDIDNLMQHLDKTYQGRYGNEERLLITSESQKGVDCLAALCDYAYSKQPSEPVSYAHQIIDGFYVCESAGIYERAVDNYAVRFLDGERNIRVVFADAYEIGGQDLEYVSLLLRYYSMTGNEQEVIDLSGVIDMLQEARNHSISQHFLQSLCDGHASLSGHVVLPLVPADQLLRRAQSFVAHIDAIKHVDSLCVSLGVTLDISHGYLYRILDNNPKRLDQLLVLCKQVGYRCISYDHIGEWFYPTSRPISKMDALRERDQDVKLLPALTKFAKDYGLALDPNVLDEYYTVMRWFEDLEMLHETKLMTSTTPQQFRQRLTLFGSTVNKYKMYKEWFVDNPHAVSLYHHIQSRTTPVVLANLGGRVLQSIVLTTTVESMHWLRGITEMMISLGIATPKDNDVAAWDAIFAQYQEVLQHKIAKDTIVTQSGEAVPKGKNTFKKIFFCGATNGKRKDDSKPEDHNNAFAKIKKLKSALQSFATDFQDVSSQLDLEGYIIHDYDTDSLESRVNSYLRAHPDGDVCVYLAFHGGTDGTIGRFTKQQINRLARISPRVLVATESCHFGYSMTNPYGHQKSSITAEAGPIVGPVSGGSGQHWGYSSYMNVFIDIMQKHEGIGFHEAELLIRARYFDSFAPLYDIQIVPDVQGRGKMRTVPVGITAIQDVPGNTMVCV